MSVTDILINKCEMFLTFYQTSWNNIRDSSFTFKVDTNTLHSFVVFLYYCFPVIVSHLTLCLWHYTFPRISIYALSRVTRKKRFKKLYMLWFFHQFSYILGHLDCRNRSIHSSKSFLVRLYLEESFHTYVRNGV